MSWGRKEDTRGFRKRVKTDSGEKQNQPIYRFVTDVYHGNYDEFFSKLIRAFRIHPPLPLPRVLLRRTKGVKPVINGTSRNRIGFTSLHLLVS